MVTTTAPKRLHAGDSASWVANFPEHPASEGWALKYSLSNASNVYTLTASPLGDDFEVSLTSTASAAFAPGLYTLIGYVEKEDLRVSVSTTRFEVLPDVTQAHDRRSQAERTLQAIRDVLEGKASDDQQMIQYAGRTLSRYTFEQLITIESKLARTVARERARKAGHRGLIGVQLR
jgi:hypothetical protein